MKHRTDIDGLRCLAILPVVAFHAGVNGISGGFVGVDVFFVISGFLIASIIIADLERNSFSITNFYARRFRRILPALTAMLLLVAVASGIVLYPARLVEFGRSMLAAALSVSNVFFQLSSGYFDAPSSTKPLLHTWSLGVEEQFYLVLPPLLILLRRYAWRHLRLILVIIAAVSFLASAAGAYKAPNFTFYELPMRAWELLLGALAGLYAPPKSRFVREGLAACGLLMILAAVTVYKSGMHFPGLTALPPCLGAALIIWAGAPGPTAVGRVLSWRPFAFIGLISYSLYLWHWPIIVLYSQAVTHPVSPVEVAMLIGASFVAAILSWRFIERPFRSGVVRLPPTFVAAGSAVAASVAAAAVFVGLHGLPFRFSPEVNRVTAYLDYASDSQFRRGSCFLMSEKFTAFDPARCLNWTADRPNVLLMGDSHVAHMYFGLAQELQGVNLLQATASGCRPTLARPADDTPRCAALMAYMFDQFLPKHRVDMLVLGHKWETSDLPDLTATLDWASANRIPVTIEGPIVEYDAALPLLIAQGLQKGRPDLPQSHVLPGPPSLDRQMAALAAGHGVAYASQYEALCSSSGCLRTAADGAPVQFDYGHLTREGSVLVARKWVAGGLFKSVMAGGAHDLDPVKPQAAQSPGVSESRS